MAIVGIVVLEPQYTHVHFCAKSSLFLQFEAHVYFGMWPIPTLTHNIDLVLMFLGLA
jgi:hypothetical protein